MLIHVLIPFPVRGNLTYHVPKMWEDEIALGMRVEVPFGKKKIYSGLVTAIDVEPPENVKIKEILQPLDPHPVVSSFQLKLWGWIAEYYACTLGEVMAAALPASLKLESQTMIYKNPDIDYFDLDLDADEYLVAEALEHQERLHLQDIKDILGKKNVYPVIESLMRKDILYVQEELQERFTDKTDLFLSLQEPYQSSPELLKEAFDLCQKSEHQTNALLFLIQESRNAEGVFWAKMRKQLGINLTVIHAMEKKGILQKEERKISRLPDFSHEEFTVAALSADQLEVNKQIEQGTHQRSLLFGVTGSGKTRVYLEAIQKHLASDRQILYLVPEIGLTVQLTERLKGVCGEELVVYHSRLNHNERVEAWNAVLNGKKVVLAARSGLLLPFRDLGLIIIDEEHDRSFKQADPAPRYHARDVAIALSTRSDIQVIMGSATPSLETLYHCAKGNHQLLELPNRFGGVEMPEVKLIDTLEALKKKQMKGPFSKELIEEIQEKLERSEQIILFHNRRGFVPITRCTHCGWHAMCRHCDISLTAHRKEGKLKCHYCGYQEQTPKLCPDCGHPSLIEEGFGTEKLEHQLQEIFQDARIQRLDWDTTRGKKNYQNIIDEFDSGDIDILVGTQMITKGLDFENVGLVGVVNADQLLFFPDFRANEKAMQTLIQVSGRAGRRSKKGWVLVQTAKPDHPVLKWLIQHDYKSFYRSEIAQRKKFHYPPYARLIHLEIKHTQQSKALKAAQALQYLFREKLTVEVSDVAQSPIPRIANYYIYQIQLKVSPPFDQLPSVKHKIQSGIDALKQQTGYSTVRIKIIVDPV